MQRSCPVVVLCVHVTAKIDQLDHRLRAESVLYCMVQGCLPLFVLLDWLDLAGADVVNKTLLVRCLSDTCVDVKQFLLVLIETPQVLCVVRLLRQ